MATLRRVLQPQLEPEVTTTPTVPDLAPGAAATPSREPPTASALPPESPQPTSQDTQSSTVQALLAERRIRLEAQKRAQDAAEKQERIAKAKARREAAEAEAARAPPGSTKARDASYAQQQRKRQQAAKLERDRIMKLVENDKVERREREERRKSSAMIAAGKSPEEQGQDTPATQLPHETERGVTTSGKEYPIQIRLLDGSTIRTRFPIDATLRESIRPWIDRQRSDGDTPYTFRQILTPLPNRAITISEEEESLQALGLAPSATLVLVPVQGYTDAYRTEPGFISGSISAGYNLVSSGASTIATAFGTLLGISPPALSQRNDESFGRDIPGSRDEQVDLSTGVANSGPGGNVRTLRTRDVDGDDRQLYNGNQVRRLIQVCSVSLWLLTLDSLTLNRTGMTMVKKIDEAWGACASVNIDIAWPPRVITDVAQ